MTPNGEGEDITLAIEFGKPNMQSHTSEGEKYPRWLQATPTAEYAVLREGTKKRYVVIPPNVIDDWDYPLFRANAENVMLEVLTLQMLNGKFIFFIPDSMDQIIQRSSDEEKEYYIGLLTQAMKHLIHEVVIEGGLSLESSSFDTTVARQQETYNLIETILQNLKKHFDTNIGENNTTIKIINDCKKIESSSVLGESPYDTSKECSFVIKPTSS